MALGPRVGAIAGSLVLLIRFLLVVVLFFVVIVMDVARNRGSDYPSNNKMSEPSGNSYASVPACAVSILYYTCTIEGPHPHGMYKMSPRVHDLIDAVVASFFFFFFITVSFAS